MKNQRTSTARIGMGGHVRNIQMDRYHYIAPVLVHHGPLIIPFYIMVAYYHIHKMRIMNIPSLMVAPLVLIMAQL